MATKKLALITGVSQGIGNALLRQLLTTNNDTYIIGTLRSANDISKTLSSLQSDHPEWYQQHGNAIEERLHLVNIDLTTNQLDGQEAATQWMRQVTAEASSKFFPNDGTTVVAPQLLINNAGVMMKNHPNYKNMTTAQCVIETLKVNFFAPLYLSESLKILHSSSSQKSSSNSNASQLDPITIVNMGARVCKLSTNAYLNTIPEISETLKNRVFSETTTTSYTVNELKELLLNSVMKNPEYMNQERLSKIPAMLPDAPYLVSKVFLHALTKIEAASSSETLPLKSIAVCPGWVKTRMGGAKAPLTPEKAASNVVQLIGRVNELENGQLYSENKVIGYV